MKKSTSQNLYSYTRCHLAGKWEFPGGKVEEVAEINNSCEIKLEVINGDSQEILAETKLTIVYDDGFYEVEE